MIKNLNSKLHNRHYNVLQKKANLWTTLKRKFGWDVCITCERWYKVSIFNITTSTNCHKYRKYFIQYCCSEICVDFELNKLNAK